MKALRAGFLALALFSIPFASAQSIPQTTGREPTNVGDAIIAASAYHDSGRYEEDLNAVLKQATDWVLQRAGKARKPAIVLDIDETSLSNWPAIRANGFGYIVGGNCDALPKGPCGAAAWEQSAQAPVIPATLNLFRQAQAHRVTVFFITGRYENERAATAKNLLAAGYKNWGDLILRPDGAHSYAAVYKAPARAAIEAKGYTIIANLGDQPSDLAGGHAERAFLLPNPFYRVP
ncbi:HAD family acid phosphatase [Kozakia baliensis]|uniref:HAD family acid phosphatase n=1 Tax=Kozakia baliensis TaxID=153496 RepID=UPI00345C0D18